MTDEINFSFIFDFVVFILVSVFWKQFRNKESLLSGRTAHVLSCSHDSG